MFDQLIDLSLYNILTQIYYVDQVGKQNHVQK